MTLRSIFVLAVFLLSANAFAQPVLSQAFVADVSCAGGNNGMAGVAVTGGTPPYT